MEEKEGGLEEEDERDAKDRMLANRPIEKRCIHDILPPEVMQLILHEADRISNNVMGVVCAFVCRLWRDLLFLKGRKGSRNIRSYNNKTRKFSFFFMAEVARCGWMSILQWARENGCPWDVSTTIAASAAGRVDVLQWAVRHGCPVSARVWRKAVKKGRENVIQSGLEENGEEGV